MPMRRVANRRGETVMKFGFASVAYRLLGTVTGGSLFLSSLLTY
jgi:hypothetical protein